MKEYSVKSLSALKNEDKVYLYPKIDTTPQNLTIGSMGSTLDNIERILLASGVITREQWEKSKGIQYDGDFDDDSFDGYDFDEEEAGERYVQSVFASYESPVIEVPNVETKAVDVASIEADTKSTAHASADSVDNGVQEVSNGKETNGSAE